METQKETFRGYGKVGELTAQTAVECRFGQEAETVLCVHCSAVLTGAEAENGGVKYYGKAHFFLVYEDAEKHVCRAEKGVEWTARVPAENCFPALTARACVAVENTSVRREGASLFVTALLGADIALYGEQSFDYLTGGDLIVKREPAKVIVAHLCGGAAETDDEFETEFVGDILLHGEKVHLSSVNCETGILRAEGEVSLGLLALKGEGLVSFERLVPFNIEIPCDAASFGCAASARVSVVDATLRAETDEEKGKSLVHAEIALTADGCIFEETEIDGIADAFSEECAVSLAYTVAESAGAGERTAFSERVSGKAALSSPIAFSDTLEAVALQRAEGNLAHTAEGARLEGVAMATLLVRGADGERRGVEMSLPFSVPVTAEDAEVSVLACGTSARQRQEGEIDAETTLKIVLCERKKLSARLVCGAEAGEPLRKSDSAVSVYIPRAGDGLWELAKSLKKPPEEVAASNPDMEFPIREGQRVIVYRKKSF